MKNTPANRIRTGAEIDSLYQSIQDDAKSAVIKAIELGGWLAEVKQSLKDTGVPFTKWLAGNVSRFKIDTAKAYIRVHEGRKKILQSGAPSIREALALLRRADADGEHANRHTPRKFKKYEGPKRADYKPTPAEEEKITLFEANGIMSRRKAIEMFRFEAHLRALKRQTLLTAGEDPEAIKRKKEAEQVKQAASLAGLSVAEFRRRAVKNEIQLVKQAARDARKK